MWSALEGSILLWVLILTGFTVHVARRFRSRLSDPLVGTALLVMFVVCLFFFLLVLGPANPFTRVDVPAGYDGPGPNPLLQEHILMAFHPPMLYLGLVGFTVPFAFAIAALATGRLGEGWLLETRRATLLAWGFLTIGIILGAWWSYEVLGWGGFWGWDPVENASLLPWLTGTAYLHSVMVQERRGMLRVWNLSLLCATFSLTILGTFLTRSGVLESVHAFSDSDIGAWFLTFFVLIVAVSLGLIGWRGDRLRSPGQIDSPVSREGAFLANNVLFAGFAFVVLLGTVFPLLAEALNDRPVTVGAPYFNRMTVPLGIALLFLMAVAPVLPWRKASQEVLAQRLLWPAWACGDRDGARRRPRCARRRHRAGVRPRRLRGRLRRPPARPRHPPAGLARPGGSRQRRHDRAHRRGDHRRRHRHQRPLRPRGGGPLRAGPDPGRQRSRDHLPQHRGRRRSGTGRPPRCASGSTAARCTSPPSPATRASGRSSARRRCKTGLIEDVYLTVTRLPDEGSDAVTLRVIIQPMALWLWVGGGVMALGTVLAAWPGRHRRRPTDPVSAPVPLDGRPRAGAGGRAMTETTTPIDPPEPTARPRTALVGVASVIAVARRPPRRRPRHAGHGDRPHHPEPAASARSRRRSRVRRSTAAPSRWPTSEAGGWCSTSSPAGASRASRSTPSCSRSTPPTEPRATPCW